MIAKKTCRYTDLGHLQFFVLRDTLKGNVFSITGGICGTANYSKGWIAIYSADCSAVCVLGF